MAIELKVPEVGESITEVEIGDWLKAEGDQIQVDETVAMLETDKVTVELPAPIGGTLTRILKQKGETASVGEVIGYVELITAKRKQPEESAKPARPSSEMSVAESERPSRRETAVRVMPAAHRLLQEHGLSPEEVEATGPGGRLLQEDVLRHLVKESSSPAEAPTPPSSEEDREEEVVPMSALRRRVAQRLVQAQQTAALLTTFNEVDLSAVIALREEYRNGFQEKYSVKLGFMSFFVKATVDALKSYPQLNAEIRDDAIVYHTYYDIGVAIGGGRGLVVPVLRNADRMSFAEIEMAIGDFARRAKANKIKLEELQGGTFTISNGGVYGSMLSTPIVNPPQSGILGMHAIEDRPVARAGQVVIRPIMYLALTYDHRVVDGREAVLFLRRIKDCIETPARMLLEI